MRAVKDAFVAFAQAHVALAKAEAGQIKGEIAWISAFIAVAAALGILLLFLVPIGGILFAGEWIFGSIGWGLLLGTELLIAVIVAAILLGLKVEGLAGDLPIPAIIGVLVALVLGASLPNLLFTRIGEALMLNVDVAARPLLVALALLALISAVIGLIVGAKIGGARGAIGGLVAFALAGALAGAFLAIDFGWRVGIALGLAVFLAAVVAKMGLHVKTAGIDPEVLKARFVPQQSIDTAKETLAWAKDRVPGMPK